MYYVYWFIKPNYGYLWILNSCLTLNKAFVWQWVFFFFCPHQFSVQGMAREWQQLPSGLLQTPWWVSCPALPPQAVCCILSPQLCTGDSWDVSSLWILTVISTCRCLTPLKCFLFKTSRYFTSNPYLFSPAQASFFPLLYCDAASFLGVGYAAAFGLLWL